MYKPKLIELKKNGHALICYFFTKRTLFLLCTLFAILIFRSAVSIKFDTWLVKPILATISSSVLSDCLILLLLPITLIIFWYYLRHNLQLHPDWVLITLFVLGLYTYCRVNHVYLLTKFQTLPQLYYADIIYLWAVGILIIKGWGELQSHKSPKYGDSPFLVDIPIKGATGDLLNRRKFAKRIASKIQSKLIVADAGALAIGVTGEWGSGKTSFSNMILEAIDTKNRIIIQFNPWRSSSAQKIIEDFFELLIAELKKYDATLSANIYSYAKTLTKIDENILTKTLQALGEVFSSTNKNKAYTSINRSIGAINKQLIIFIDDLDRLDKLEIIEVLRIIRNTANFNNVIYLVSYDKGYVLEAVKAFNEYNYQSFLEKIFQFEFALPMYESGIIRKYLKGLLKDGLSQNLHDQVEAIVDSSLHKEINFTNEIIGTHREAIRLANSVLFEITDLENDVFFYDFYLLQLIKLQYPFVYRGIIEYKSLFFINDPKDNDTFLRLRREHERGLSNDTLGLMMAVGLSNDSKQPGNMNEEEPIFHNYLTQHKKQFALTDYDIFLIEEIMDELLEAGRQINAAYKNEFYKVFCRAENFFKYFAFELMEGEIPSIEFERARTGEFDAYTKQVNKWIEEGKWQAFQDRLLKIEDFADRHEFENHIKALFQSGKALAKSDNVYQFNYKYLIRILGYPNDALLGTDLRLYTTIEEYQNFLRELLKSEDDDKRFEARLLQMIIDHEPAFVLPFGELAEISLNYLKHFIAAEMPLNDIFWSLLGSSRIRLENDYRGIQNPEAKELGSAYYLSHVDACELGSFIRQTSPDSIYYHFTENWNEYFPSIKAFKEWFDTANQLEKDSDCYQEFLDFYEATAINDFRGVKWDFKYLTPIRWNRR